MIIFIAGLIVHAKLVLAIKTDRGAWKLLGVSGWHAPSGWHAQSAAMGVVGQFSLIGSRRCPFAPPHPANAPSSHALRKLRACHPTDPKLAVSLLKKSKADMHPGVVPRSVL